MTLAARKFLIIGGGFSGMSAAIALRRQGAQVDLVEIDPGWRSYGAGISLGGATLRAFRQLGILDAFLAQGAAADGVELRLPHGAPLAQLPTPRLAGPDVPGGGAILRPVLARILADATRAAGTNVHLGCTFDVIEQDAEGVNVRFSDGRTGRYDLVIGADGLYSKVREAVFPDAPQPRYSGQGVWRAVLPRPDHVQTCMMWTGADVKPGLNPVSAEQMYMFITETSPTRPRIDEAEAPSRMAALLAPFADPLLQELRGQINAQAQVIYRPLEGLLMSQPWHRGRVVLIGDTVHATTPHLASGACIGIEDALVLADELSRGAPLAQSLAAFQDRRWSRCRMVVENSARLGEIEMQHGDKAEHAAIMRASLMALAEAI